MWLWRPVGKAQVVTLEVDQFVEVPIIERPGESEDFPVVEVEFVGENLEDLLGCVGFDLESHCRGEPSLFQNFLDHLDEILGDLLVAPNLGVSGHAKEGGVDHFDVGKQQIEVLTHHVLEENVPGVVVDFDEPNLVARDLHPRERVLRVGRSRVRTASERL